MVSPQGETTAVQSAGLTLEQAIATAVQNNPKLVAQRLDAGVARAQILAAAVYPFNPQFNSTLREARFAGGGHGEDQLYGLSQELELAGQRGKRQAEADASHQRVLWEIEAAETGVAVQVRRLFFTTIYRRQKWELANSIAKLNQNLLEALERRFQAQQATLADVSVARVEARDAARRSRAAMAEYQAARVELRRVLGAIAKFDPVPLGELYRAVMYPEMDETPDLLVDQAVAVRRDLKARQAEVNAASARVRLARAGRMPNVTVGVEYERDESATRFVGATVSVPIPFRNDNRGVIAQREAEYIRAAGQAEQLRTEIRQETEAAFERFQRAREQALANESDISDGLEIELKRVEDLFNQGEADLLRVYEVRQKLNQVRDSHLDSLFELQQSESDLAAALGQPFLTVRQPGDKPKADSPEPQGRMRNRDNDVPKLENRIIQ
jgi:cobalt-zinc-cadmium efflux system outer membrane protein